MRTLFLLTLLLPLVVKAQQNKSVKEKSTSTPLRCASISLWKWSGSEYYFDDSTVFIYSSSRTSNFDAYDFDTYINFDSCLNYSFNATTLSYVNTSRVMQTFDSYDNIQTKTNKTWNSGTSAWQNAWGYQHLFTYDASNRIFDDVLQTMDTATSVWVNSTELLTTYDGSGKVTCRLRKRWNTATSLWDGENRNWYTYDDSGKLIIDSIETFAGSWINYYKRTLNYSSGNLISDQYQQWSPSGWQNASKTSYSSFIADVPGLLTYTLWNTSKATYDTTARRNYTYNSYGQPELVTFQHWNPSASSFVNYSKTRYYYEYPTAVSNIVSNDNAIIIYPVPAANTLNIAVEWSTAQAFTLGIYDVTGKLLNSWNIPTCAKHTQAISVSDLMPGNYVIRLQGAHGSESRQIRIK